MNLQYTVFVSPAPTNAVLSYTVTYNVNGYTSGSAPGSQSWTGGLWLLLSANSGNLAKAGYTFAGWNTKADGTGIDYAAGSAAKLGALNRTLYAKWKLNTVTITWNASPGNVSPSSQQRIAGSVMGAVPMPTPTRQGYIFSGWWTAASGAGTEILSSTPVP